MRQRHKLESLLIVLDLNFEFAVPGPSPGPKSTYESVRLYRGSYDLIEESYTCIE